MSVEITGEGFNSRIDTHRLFGFLRNQKLPETLNQTLTAFTHHFGVSFARSRNTTLMLSDLGLVQVDESNHEIIRIDDNLGLDELDSAILDWLCSELVDRIVTSPHHPPIEMNKAQGTYHIDSMRIPTLPWQMNHLLVEFSATYRENLSDRFWKLSDNLSNRLLTALEEACKQSVPLGLTLEALKASLDSQRVQGATAENWVVEFEKNRLSDHPFVNLVRAVSTEAVDAGFDVLSFSSESALKHDLFIEVKSYQGSPHFYLSRNEILTATKLLDQYRIYLVDMAEYKHPKYTPTQIRRVDRIIANPENTEWLIESDGILIRSRG